jgi:osmotically-inducible protein OsmY
MASLSTRVFLALLAAIATCAIDACATTPRTPAQRVADADIARQVQNRLLEDPNIYARHIDVWVDRGVVHLDGYVWESVDYQTARRDAASVDGVKSVDTEMQLMRNGWAGKGR